MTSSPNGQATLSSVRSSVAMMPEKSASWNAFKNEPRPLSGDVAVWQALRKTSPPEVAAVRRRRCRAGSCRGRPGTPVVTQGQVRRGRRGRASRSGAGAS